VRVLVAGVDELGRLRSQLADAVVLDVSSVPTMVFQALLLDRGAFHIRHQEWPTTARPADVVWPAVCSSTNGSLSGECARVFDLGSAVARLFLSEDGVAKASFAAADADVLDTAEQTLRSLLPRDAEALASEDRGPRASYLLVVRSPQLDAPPSADGFVVGDRAKLRASHSLTT